MSEQVETFERRVSKVVEIIRPAIQAVKQRVDGVTAVEHVGEQILGASEGTAVSL